MQTQGKSAQLFDIGLSRDTPRATLESSKTMTAVESQVLHRIRAEYLEMPGLFLTADQIQRLCGVDQAVCETALRALVESGFLSVRPDGAYGRFRDPDISRARPAKAILEPSVIATMARLRARAI